MPEHTDQNIDMSKDMNYIIDCPGRRELPKFSIKYRLITKIKYRITFAAIGVGRQHAHRHG